MQKFLSEGDKRVAVAASETAEEILRKAEGEVAKLLSEDLMHKQLPLELVGICQTVRSMCRNAVEAAHQFRHEVGFRKVH